MAGSVLYLLRSVSSLLLKCGTAHMFNLHTTGLRLPKNRPALPGRTIALNSARVCAAAQLFAVLSLLAWLHQSMLTLTAEQLLHVSTSAVPGGDSRTCPCDT